MQKHLKKKKQQKHSHVAKTRSILVSVKMKICYNFDKTITFIYKKKITQSHVIQVQSNLI